MSYDLGIWYSSYPLTDAEADERYSAFLANGNGNGPVATDERLSRFVDELTSRFPQIDDVSEDEIDACPWSVAFDLSSSHVCTPIMWARAEDVAPFVLELAERHGLVCYDPQSRKVHLPPGLQGV